jgi:hypothetical protein
MLFIAVRPQMLTLTKVSIVYFNKYITHSSQTRYHNVKKNTFN